MTQSKNASTAMSEASDIAYQNKDITSKILAEGLREKSFAVYGVDVPKIIQVLPTNLPAIEANELRMDHLFLLEDQSYALIDYESDYDEADKIKYASYITRTLKRLRMQGIKKPFIRMIVLYTSNITKVNTTLDVGSMRLTIEPGYLFRIPADNILLNLELKISDRKELSSEELMQLIILPLTAKKRNDQKSLLQKCITLAQNIKQEQQSVFALSGIITFSDKIIETDYANEIRRWILMTKVGKLFELEKQEALLIQKCETARNLSSLGVTIELIAQALNENISTIQLWLEQTVSVK